MSDDDYEYDFDEDDLDEDGNIDVSQEELSDILDISEKALLVKNCKGMEGLSDDFVEYPFQLKYRNIDHLNNIIEKFIDCEVIFSDWSYICNMPSRMVLTFSDEKDSIIAKMLL